MANFYTLISYDGKNRDSFYLQRQLPKQELSIGWGEVNPIGSTAAKIKRDIKKFYPGRASSPNPWNGSLSLPLFSNLKSGDIVFVRGNRQILDVAIITGPPFYAYGLGHDRGTDYCTKVPFTPLYSGRMLQLPVSSVPNPDKILNAGGSRLVMRKLANRDAVTLLKAILDAAS